MAESEIHPGSFVGDTVEEFKKLPPWGKAALAAGLGLLLYLFWRSRQNSAQAVAGQSLPAAGSQSPYPSVNGLPVLPNNVNPVYDPLGNLVGYQNGPTPPGGTTPPVQPPTPKPPIPIEHNHKPPGPRTTPPPPPNQPGGPNPLIPYGQYRGPNYSNLQPNTYYTYNGTRYLLATGAGGRLWGKTSSGQQVLLYAPASYYHHNAGGPTAFSFMSNPLIYWASAKPHPPSSVPGTLR